MKNRGGLMAGNLNSGKPWSEKDLADLERALDRGYPIELIAGYLMRDAEEVRQMRDALPARPQPTRRPADS